MFNTKTLAEPYDFIWSADDSLVCGEGQAAAEKLGEQMRMFRESGGDQSHLDLHPGTSPTVFKIAHLRGAASVRVRDLIDAGYSRTMGVRESYYKIVQLSLVSVDGELNPDGSQYKIKMAKIDGLPGVHPSSMADICDVGADGDLLDEMALRIIVETFGRD